MAEKATRYAPVAPYLMVDDGAAAIDFYTRAFGAQARDRYDDKGKVGHVSLTVNGGDVMLCDEYPEYAAMTGTLSPRTLGGTSATINLYVDDVDAWYTRAMSAGAASLRPPTDEFYGRGARLRDPFGHVWGLVAPTKP